MNSSVPNEKEKTPQTTTGQAPMVLPSDSQPATNPPPASDSDSSKGGGAPQQSGQYVVGVPPQQGEIPTWSTGLFECFDDLPTRKSNHIYHHLNIYTHFHVLYFLASSLDHKLMYFLSTVVITAFAPCVTYGQIAEMIDRGQQSKFSFQEILKNDQSLVLLLSHNVFN